MNKEKIVSKVGGIWENPGFEIRFNERFEDEENACPHCEELTSESYGKAWLCPKVIVATNEGGYNTTGVCLDCVLDIAKTHNFL